MEILCPWEAATNFWMYSSNVPPLLYYSHIPALVIALLWGIFIFLHAPRDIRTYSLVAIFGFFALWNGFDLILWATNRPDVTIFFWSLQVLLEVLVFLFSFYLVYTYQKKENPPNWANFLILLGVVPFILLISTKYNLIGVNLADCTAVENIVAKYYSYILEAIFLIAIAIVSLENYRKTLDKERRKEIILMSLGVFIFLLFFIYGNLIGSFFDSWIVAQFGLFGMPIFVTLLVYATVKFKTFNVKMLGAQALVGGLWILVAAILSVRSIESVRIITSLTLIIVLILGIMLVRGVKREIEQREKIERLAGDLERANAKLRELDQLKSEFLSFASHQLRAPLSAIDGYASMLLEGDFGEMPAKVKESVQVIDTSSKSLIKIVNEFLDVSRIEQGRMKYDMADFNAKKLAEEVVAELRPNVEKKGLSFEFKFDEGENYIAHGDSGKIKQVIGNIIDNSIKYTPSGGVKVHVGRKEGKILISVTDTGIGIDKEDIPKLFSEFGRTKDAHKTNVSGTGLGLYVAKQMVEAQKGRVSIESEGKGKGSTFFIELPAKN